MDIELVFTNVAAFHSSATGSARVSAEGKWVGEGQGFPCVRTRFMPIVGGADGQGARFPVDIPIMPANTMRYVLRKAMLFPILEQFRGKYTLSTGSYAAMHVGNASGNPDGIVPTYDEIIAVRQHPFLGMFGGGPRMIEGRLKVDAAWPITPVTLPYVGALEEYATGGVLTKIVSTPRRDPVLAMSEEDFELIQNAEEAITEWHSRAAGGSEEGDVRGLRSLPFHEVVIPGLSWFWRISVQRPTPAQKGLLLHALSMLNNTHIGGMSRWGYGRIRLNSLNIEGKELWDGQGLADDDEAMSWLQAWADTVDSLTPDAFESFAASKKASTKGAEAGE